MTSDKDWKVRLLRTDKLKFRVCLANAVIALEDAPPWQGVLRHDEFTMATMAKKPPPWDRGNNDWKARQWEPTDDLRLADWLQHELIYVSPDTAGQAVEMVARQSRFHPVRDYFDSLSWDGRRRLKGWLPKRFIAVHRTFLLPDGRGNARARALA